jgi:hypothetical protein
VAYDGAPPFPVEYKDSIAKNVKVIRKGWFNTPRLAAVQIRQRLQKLGIKPTVL